MGSGERTVGPIADQPTPPSSGPLLQPDLHLHFPHPVPALFRIDLSFQRFEVQLVVLVLEVDLMGEIEIVMWTGVEPNTPHPIGRGGKTHRFVRERHFDVVGFAVF